jgi:UDP-N-acetyl-2-amino-2-deoxyglucuronate dehydrogenase
MIQRIPFAVVGCGKIGTRHIAVIDAEERAELVGICDSDYARAQKLSDMYEGIPIFSNLGDMLHETHASVVNVATPHYLHADMAIQIAEAGKHILVEKPMALTTYDAKRMISAAQANNVRLMVVKQNRYNVPIRLTKDIIDSGKLGRVFMVQCNVMWNRYDGYYSESPWLGRIELEGGSLYTQVSHFLDLLIWWFGDITSVRAQIGTKNHSIEIEDCGVASLEFSSHVLGSLFWTTCTYNKNYEGSITIIGEYGTIKIGGQYLNKIEYWDVRAHPLPDNVEFVDKPNNYGKYQGTSSNHDKVVRDICALLLKEPKNIVEGEEAMKTVTAIEKIYAATKH